MGPHRRRAATRRLVLISIAALLSTVTIFGLDLGWFYLFRHDTASTLRRPPPQPNSAMQEPSSRPRAPGAAAPVVKLRQGTYVGATHGRGRPDAHPRAPDLFLGIPYAQSTAGENRFRPAVPVPPSDANSSAPRPTGRPVPGANSTPPRGRGLPERQRVPPARRRRRRAGQAPPRRHSVHGGGFNAGFDAERNMASFVSWRGTTSWPSARYRVGAPASPRR